MDARNTKLESIKDLHKIFTAATQIVPSERLYVSPNTGLEFLPHQQAAAKLRNLVEAVSTWRN